MYVHVRAYKHITHCTNGNGHVCMCCCVLKGGEKKHVIFLVCITYVCCVCTCTYVVCMYIHCSFVHHAW